MSAAQRRITLTETDDGHWRAQVEPDGLSGSGETIEEALDALGDARLAPIEEILDALDDEDIDLFDPYEPVLNALGAFNDEEIDRILAALDEADRDEDDARVFDDGGEHDPDGPFFSAPALDAEDGKPIEVADTDEILGDALADEWDGADE